METTSAGQRGSGRIWSSDVDCPAPENLRSLVDCVGEWEMLNDGCSHDFDVVITCTGTFTC